MGCSDANLREKRNARGPGPRGVHVDAFSLKRPPRGDDLEAHWLTGLALISGLVRAAAQHPFRAASLLVSIRRARLRNVPALLAATLIGLAWSGSGLIRNRLHSHFGWVSGAATRAAALHAGVGYSVVYHAFDLHDHGRVDGLARQIAQSADQVFVISERDVPVAEKSLGVTPDLLRMGVPDEWLAGSVSVRAYG